MNPKIQEPDVLSTCSFGAKLAKIIRLQLYGSDFVNSVRQTMADKKPVGVAYHPSGSASVKI